MGADRVLIEIMTQANLGGVAKAEKGMLGLGTSIVGATAAVRRSLRGREADGGHL
jgi:hypothetical protein